MRAQRTLARLAAAGAMLAAAAGGALTSPGSAAAIEPNYPAPPPSVTVSQASVTLGQSVRLTGIGFASREPVSVSIRTRTTLRPNGSGPTIRQGAGVSRANDDGAIRDRVHLSLPGYATITVTGKRSGKTASASVRVLSWWKPWPRQWRNAEFATSGGAQVTDAFLGVQVGPDATGTEANGTEGASAPEMTLAGNTTTVEAGKAGSDDRGVSDSAQLLAGLLGVVGMLGSGLVAFRVVRRRGDASA